MWDNAKELAKEGRFDEIPSELLIKHLNAFQQIRNIEISKSKPILRFNLRLWQQDLLDKLLQEPDSRTIYWYWEAVGTVGKSWMATFLARNHGALTISTGKTADIAYMFQPTKIVCFDVSRAVDMEHVNFSVMEDIKNGRLMSSKYMSCVKYFDTPHVVVFANLPPPHGKFSADRLQIVEIGAAIPPIRPVTSSSYAPNFASPVWNDQNSDFVPPPFTRLNADDLDLDQDILDILNNH